MKNILIGLCALTLLSFNSLAHTFNGNWYFVKGEYIKPDGENCLQITSL
ncbi:hypothetical protein HR060_16745 [Catenovulum sp. SM1970]|nr:hypothetical protein [Marinifaba aquimaris]NTS78494.1 hypothetical protein [Marinifaba aquimaris]